MSSSSFLPAFCRPVGRMRARALPAACAAALLSLAACGGGGSGTPAGSDQSVRITEQNAQPIVSNAFQAADSVYGIGLDASGATLDLKDARQRRKPSMMDLALQREIPLGNGILTVDNEHQAKARLGGDHGHKGVDAARAALVMARLKRSLKGK